MLILRRKTGESFLIGDDVRVTIVATKDKEVQIAIDAPKEVSVLRCEPPRSRVCPRSCWTHLPCCPTSRRRVRPENQKNKKAAELKCSAAFLIRLFGGAGSKALPRRC